MLNISPVGRSIPDSDKLICCTDDCIASVANWLGKGYTCMYANTWSFFFQPKGALVQPFMERTDFPKPSLDYLSSFHGIDLSFTQRPKDRKDELLLLELLEQQLTANMPVLVGIDVYECPWSTGYQIVHIEHSCLVIGLDRVRNEIQLMDAFHNKHCETLPWSIFQKSCDSYGVFEATAPTYDPHDWNNLLERSLCSADKRVQLMQSFLNLEAFAAAYAQEGLPACSSERLMLPQNFVLMKFELNRKRYALLLNQLYQFSNQRPLHEAAVKLLEMAACWEAIRFQMIKIALSGNKETARIKLLKTLQDVIAAEQRIMEQLLEWFERTVRT